MTIFLVKETILSSLDGTFENNTIGAFKTKESALKALDQRVDEILADTYKDLVEETKINKGIDYFCMESTECWYEFCLELNIEEITIKY